MIELPYLLDWSEVHCNHTQRSGLQVMEWVIWKSQCQEHTTLLVQFDDSSVFSWQLEYKRDI